MVPHRRREQIDVTWRAEWPAEAVGGRVAKIREKEMENTLMFPNTDLALPWRFLAGQNGETRVIDTKKGWKAYTKGRPSPETMVAQFPEHEGAAVWVRPCLVRATLAMAMRQQGIRTIAETDDNYFAKAHLNLFSRYQGASELTHEMHAKAMASMGVNVFSTAWLRDRYMKEYRTRFGKKHLPEMHVCRNHLPSWAWPKKQEYDGPLRFGFMGSPSHVWDVNLAYASFHAAKFNGLHTTMIGYSPANPDPHIPDEVTADGVTYQTRTEESRRVSDKWNEVVDEHIRWIDPGEYHRASIPLDIGIAPLLWNDFTAGKSDIKMVEYAANGAVPVGSNHPVYTSAGWKDGVNCLLGGSQLEMAEKVVRLIREPNLRAELVAAGQEMIRSERSEVQMRDEWLAALSPS